MVNGGVLEVGAGGSGLRWLFPGVSDPQGLVARVSVSAGSISPALHATNRLAWTEVVGEVLGLSLSPASLASGPAGTEPARTASVSLARLASLSRVGRRRLRPVLKHGPRSLTCARVTGFTKPTGVVKAKASAEGRSFWRSPGASLRPRFVRSSKSVHVGTRKMVNYAWPG